VKPRIQCVRRRSRHARVAPHPERSVRHAVSPLRPPGRAGIGVGDQALSGYGQLWRYGSPVLAGQLNRG